MNSNFMLVFKKELLDIFRDKKTIFITILIPLLLFPVIFFIMGNTMDKTVKEVNEQIKITIEDSKDSSLSKFLKEQKNIKVIESNDIEKSIEDGEINLAIKIPDNFDDQLKNGVVSDVSLIYDNVAQSSMMASELVDQYIQDYSKDIVKQRLEEKNISPQILTPIQVKEVAIDKDNEGHGKFMLSLLLPLFLMIYCVSGPMPAATDLGAGEKERGTLEPLLTTKANRLSLLYGKLLAITVMGVLTSLCSVISLLITFKITPDIFTGGSGGNVSVGLDPKALIIIFIFIVLTTMAFGALELAISIYARSFKEAQTYLTPLTLLSFVPVYMTYMLDIKNVSLVYLNIPIANVVVIIKEVISSVYNPVHIGIVLAWVIVYTVVSIYIAKIMFNKENVIFRT